MTVRTRFPHYPINHYELDLETLDLSKLSEKERWRVEHQRLHEKHRGHESMHLEMVLILIVTLVVAQIILVQWKQWHFKSYQKATLLGMWLIPVGISIKFNWWRFILIWTVFSSITGLMTFKATRKPIAGTTPRWVYKWFLLIYKLSYGAGILGYMVIMFALLGLNMLLLIKPSTAMDFGLLIMFYGLYFGVVARDFAEVCADSMAAHIGYYTTTGLPGKRLDPNICAVCGNKILVMDNEEGVLENSYRLSCNHVWDRPHVLYGNFLDWIRYLVAWQPVIILAVQGINWSLGLE